MLNQRVDRRLTIGFGQSFRSCRDRLLHDRAHVLVTSDLLDLLASLLSLLPRLPEQLLEVLLKRPEHARRLGGAGRRSRGGLGALARGLHRRADNTARAAEHRDQRADNPPEPGADAERRRLRRPAPLRRVDGAGADPDTQQAQQELDDEHDDYARKDGAPRYSPSCYRYGHFARSGGIVAGPRRIVSSRNSFS